MSVTLTIVDLWQYHAWCIRSGVTRCTLCMALNLCSMCQCGLYSVLWPHIGIRMRLLVAGRRSPAGLLFPSHGTILLTLYSIACDWLVWRAGPMLFYWPTLLASILSSTVFHFSSSSDRFALWGFGLWTDRVWTLSPSLPQRTSFNNNNHTVKINQYKCHVSNATVPFLQNVLFAMSLVYELMSSSDINYRCPSKIWITRIPVIG